MKGQRMKKEQTWTRSPACSEHNMPKTECEHCRILEERDVKVVFESDKILAFLHPKPAAPGHVVVVSKQHFPIIENVPDFIVSDAFKVANRISSAVFEGLGVQGTNIIVQNGVAAGQKVAHFAVNVIPRRQDDNLSLQWQPKQLDEEEMSTIELKIKEQTASIGEFEQETAEPVDVDKKKVEKVKGSEKDNMLIKQLRKIP
ncbi:HIT domain-containing protein [Candidatus Woesearchaeota archaeon]|nr:HIT domain-containing protein [Candidatus Woesearchaeota archaeon]